MVNIHGLKFEFLGNIKYVNKFLKCIKVLIFYADKRII